MSEAINKTEMSAPENDPENDSENAPEKKPSVVYSPRLMSLGRGISGTNLPREGNSMWLVTFTDMMALMLTFFVLLYAMSAPEEEQWSEMTSALHGELREFEMPKWYSGQEDSVDIRKVSLSNGLNLDYIESLLDAAIADDKKLSNINLIEQKDHIMITLPQDLVFAKGRATVNEDGQRALYVLGGVLSKIKNRVEIVGHADPDPILNKESPFDSNWELSLARASSVANMLTSVGYSRAITVRGMSSARYDELPSTMSGDTRREIARRVDIAVYRDDGQTRGFLNLGGGR